MLRSRCIDKEKNGRYTKRKKVSFRSEKETNTTIDLSKHTYIKEGYVFEGWYTDKELTDKVTSIKLTDDIVLYANWVEGEDTTPSKPNYHPDILTTEHYAYIVGREGNRIEPEANITRAEVMTLVNRVLNRIPESEDDLHEDMTRWEDNADTNAWYYLAVQEATNSHKYQMKADGSHEQWTELTKNPDWTQLEK